MYVWYYFRIGSGRNSVEIVSRSFTLSSDTRIVAISALLPAVPGMVAVKPHGYVCTKSQMLWHRAQFGL